MGVKEDIASANLPIIWVLGGPGSGKGTQCEEIAMKYQYTHLSTGELLRACVMSGTPKGIQLFGIMEQGHHVPDDEVIKLLAEAMQEKVGSTKGFLIDGFPASIEQADIFESEIGSPTKILALEAHEEVLKGRLKDRGNFDDRAESIAKRIQLFVEKTRPVIDKYKKIVKQVNAERASKEVFEDVCKAL
eukprot:TRINITY_DN14371_c0_g1_i1.p1 TRINITY_DN14371_c0_g1~~TRINITY_DN14371_c0_g1_i1.p1  ORF type:complete len:189 (-),score=59.51 TRINITY_DN14371_c0_g1_i1:191-757(-)